MKRDMELIRAILLEAEKLPPGQAGVIKIEGHSMAEVCAHVKLAEDVRLVEARYIGPLGVAHCVVTRLTNAGHDFLESAKSETRWARAKNYVKEHGLELTVSGLQLAFKAIEAQFLK